MIQQGHKYIYRGHEVIAIKRVTNDEWLVGVNGDHWFIRKEFADANDLLPLPMKYFKGQVE